MLPGNPSQTSCVNNGKHHLTSSRTVAFSTELQWTDIDSYRVSQFDAEPAKQLLLSAKTVSAAAAVSR